MTAYLVQPQYINTIDAGETKNLVMDLASFGIGKFGEKIEEKVSNFDFNKIISSIRLEGYSGWSYTQIEKEEDDLKRYKEKFESYKKRIEEERKELEELNENYNKSR